MSATIGQGRRWMAIPNSGVMTTRNSGVTTINDTSKRPQTDIYKYIEIYGKINISEFLNIFRFFRSNMVSRRSGRYLETFLEPVAPLSSSMGPWRATATPFSPKIMDFVKFPKPEVVIFSKNPKSQNRAPISPNSGVLGGWTHLISSAIPW